MKYNSKVYAKQAHKPAKAPVIGDRMVLFSRFGGVRCGLMAVDDYNISVFSFFDHHRSSCVARGGAISIEPTLAIQAERD